MKAVLWARVSDPRRESQGAEAGGRRQVQQDVENQLGPLRAVAARQGWEVVREFRVEGSAWNKDPPEKMELLELLRQGNVDLVAVWDVDRWSRSAPVVVLTELVELEKHLGVHFFSLNQPFLSTATLDPGLRQALIAIYAWLSEAESRKRSERVLAAVATKRNRSGNLGVDPKWGRGKIPSDATKARVAALRDEHPGWSLIMIGKEVGVSKSTVFRILKERDANPSSVPNHL